MDELSQNDLVLYSNPDGKIYSGGFNINSILFNKDLSPIFNINTQNKQSGGSNVSDLFENLAIPRGLLHFNNPRGGYEPTEGNAEETDVIDDDVYNKLLNLVDPKQNKHTKTKHKKTKNKGGTKKRKH
jgi:hypothetical protein